MSLKTVLTSVLAALSFGRFAGSKTSLPAGVHSSAPARAFEEMARRKVENRRYRRGNTRSQKGCFGSGKGNNRKAHRALYEW